LIQKGRGGGLSGAFGGDATGGILGSKTGDFLTWFTVAIVGVFLTLAVAMAKFYRPTLTDFGPDQAVQQEAPVSPEQPLAPVTPGGEGDAANSQNN